jgi:hypothetical protein
MRITTSAQYALAACATVAMLAGCNGNTRLNPPQGLASVQSDHGVQPSSDAVKSGGPLNGEVFTGTFVHVFRPKNCGRGHVAVSFRANGNAAGRYYGTFRATGGWSAYFNSQSGYWVGDVAETFTLSYEIPSKQKTGRIEKSYNDVTKIPKLSCVNLPSISATYYMSPHLNRARGDVSIGGIGKRGSFEETFH